MPDDDLTLKLAAQVDGFQNDIKEALGSWNGFLRDMVGGTNALNSISIGFAAVTAAAFGLAKKVAETGDYLLTMSERTGITVKDLSLLKFAAEQSDTNLSSVVTSVKHLSKAMLDAQEPGSKQSAIFDAISVSTKNADGTLRPMKDVLLDIADRFKEIPDPTLKSAIAMEVFGKNGTEILGFLNQGGVGLEKLMQKGEALGASWDKLSAQQASDFRDSLNELETASKSLGKELGQGLIPMFTKLAEDTTSAVVPIFEFMKGLFYEVASAETHLAEAGAAMWFGMSKITDLLHITSGASAEVYQLWNDLKGSADDLSVQASEAFKKMVSGIDNATDKTKTLHSAQDALTQQQKDSIAATINRDKIEAEAAKREKAAIEQTAKGREILIRALNDELETKKAEKKFDDDYFNILGEKLLLEGKTVQQVETIVRAERQKTADMEKNQVQQGTQIQAKGLQEYLAIRKQYGQIDSEYFLLYKKMLEDQGLSAADIQRRIADEAIKSSKAQIDAAEKARQRDEQIMAQWFPVMTDYLTGFKDFAFQTWDYFKSSFGDAVGKVIVEGGNLHDELKAIFKRILEQFISTLVQFGVEYAAMNSGLQAFALSHPIVQPVVMASDGGAGAAVTGASGVGAAGSATGAAGAGSGGVGATAPVAAAVVASAYAFNTGMHADNTQEQLTAVAINPTAGVAGLIAGATQHHLTTNEKLIRAYGQAAVDAARAAIGDHTWDTLSGDQKSRLIEFVAGHGGAAPTAADRQILGFAAGAFVTKPTLAMIAEGGEPEAVIPLSKMKAMGFGGGGGGHVFNFNFPNVRDVKELARPEWRDVIKGNFLLAIQDLAGMGYQWPMPTRST